MTKNGNPNQGSFIVEELTHLVEEAILAEKDDQLNRLATFQAENQDKAPTALAKLQEVALSGGNVFAELMETVKVCSLGQVTAALHEVGGKYRRNM